MTNSTSRREFIKRVAALSATGTVSPLALNLAAISSASAFSSGDDYKAIVCVFLSGGNDHANTVVPFDTASYEKYAKFRPQFAIQRENLIPLAPLGSALLPDARQYAFAPGMEGLANLFNGDSKKLAVLLNIGTMIEPTSKLAYEKKSVRLPPRLASHNDQSSFWQASAVEGSRTGWAGLMGDILAGSNATAAFTCINTHGNVVFMTGNKVDAYRVSGQGAVAIEAIQSNLKLANSTACSDLLKELISNPKQHTDPFRSTYANFTKRSIDCCDSFNQKVNMRVEGSWWPQTGRPRTPLEQQLYLVAKVIAARQSLGVKRQVFFVQMGGFDTHQGLAEKHPGLIKIVADSLTHFYQATANLGVADNVTTFTASEFGRSWGNETGSDHGWGSMQFVLGGAVNGGRFIGDAPEIYTANGSYNAAQLRKGGPDDIGNGRLLPKIAVDHLGGTLSSWMGIPDDKIREIFPNLGNWQSGWNAASHGLKLFA